MSGAVLRCPACGAPDHSAAGVDGVHVCEHCGCRYRWRPGEERGTVLPAEAAGVPPVRVAVLSLLLVLGLGGAVAAGLIDVREDPSPVQVRVVDPGDAPRDPVVPPVLTASTPAPPPPPEPSAELSVHGTVPGYQDSFYVLAEVRNTSPYVIDKPRLTVVLRDESGAEVFQDDGYVAIDYLAPEQVAPAKVLVKDPPPHADFSVELELRASTYVPRLAEGLELETLDPSVDAHGRYRVGGQVHNRGQTSAHFVEVLLVARDVDGTLIDLDTTYAVGQEALAPGGSARFTFNHLDYPRPPASWDFVVTGRVVD